MRLIAASAVSAMVAFGMVTSAKARLVYEPDVMFQNAPEMVWIARDDGTQAHPLVAGGAPRISPDGRLVVYRGSEGLMLISTLGGRARTLLSGHLTTPATWSPDSRRVAVIVQSPTKTVGAVAGTLLAVDVASGRVHTVARKVALYAPVSFSPDSRSLVYPKSSANPLAVAIYRSPVAGGRALRVTSGPRDESPVWGREWIAFSRNHGSTLQDLCLIKPTGVGLHRLTKNLNIRPIDWSADGRRMIAELGVGNEIPYVVAVNPRTGALRRVGRPSSEFPLGMHGISLSRDGGSILGYDEYRERIVTLPFRGGAVRVLASNALSPSWSR